MKRTGNIYPILISDENLRLALEEVNRTHRWNPRHRPNRVVAWVESDVPARIRELRAIIEEGFTPSPAALKRRWDKSAGKWRDIHEPKLWPDQYVHHALIQAIQPTLMRGMDPFCCGSIRGRGIHERITREGIQIGAYCSQWFANTVLQPLDHALRESGLAVRHYLRYMDNFTLFARSKRALSRAIRLVDGWLRSHGLTLKGNWQKFPTADRLPSALGYRYGHGYTLLRKRNLLRLGRQLRSCYRKWRCGAAIPLSLAVGLLSRLGQLRHCRSTALYARMVKPKTQRRLKAVVRAWWRKERARWTTSLEARPGTA